MCNRQTELNKDGDHSVRIVHRIQYFGTIIFRARFLPVFLTSPRLVLLVLLDLRPRLLSSSSPL